MSKAQKYDFKTKSYHDYELPSGATNYCADMDKPVACACCGKTLPYGDTYTSRVIQTLMGFGYGVCRNCYEEELIAESKRERR